MKKQSFGSAEALSASGAELLLSNLQPDEPGEIALMLSGGRTPLSIYDIVARSGIRASGRVHLFLSDERMVPPDSEENNHRSLIPLLRALSIPEERDFQVPTAIPVDEAADRFHQGLKSFLESNGRIPLGFLGLGADGHTASLFSLDDARRGEGRFAIPVRRPSGPDRVSVTPGLLGRVERIVFLVAGEEKKDALDHLLHDPDSIPAGLAVRDHPKVEVWYPSNIGP